MVFTWRDKEQPSLGDNVTLHTGCALHPETGNLKPFILPDYKQLETGYISQDNNS